MTIEYATLWGIFIIICMYGLSIIERIVNNLRKINTTLQYILVNMKDTENDK